MRILKTLKTAAAGFGIAVAAFSFSAQAGDYGSGSKPMDASNYQLRGAYAGISFGYGFLSDYDAAIDLYAEGDDYVYGAHIGYQKEFGKYTLGAEIEYGQHDITFDDLPFDVTVERTIAAKLRAGMKIDRVHVYGVLGITQATTNINLKDNGLLFGVGFDYAFTDHILIGAEYNRHQYNEFDGTQIDAELDTMKVRLSYMF